MADSTQRSWFKRVVVPTEHGAWAYAIEPIVLGLLLAWSLPGLAIGCSALIAFLGVRPLDIWLTDRFRNKVQERTKPAKRFAIALLTLAGIAGMWGVSHNPVGSTPYLLVSAGAGGAFFWLHLRDRQSTWREPLAAVSIAPVASLILVLGGHHHPIDGLILTLLRSLPTIFYVRERLNRELHRPVSQWRGLLPSIAALPLGLWVNPKASIALILLLLRAGWGLSRFSWPSKPKYVGLREAAWGAIYVFGIALALRA